LELCSQLHKYIKPKDIILITGCGNSGLSADMYDVGYQNITNIDVSEVVIKQMNSINAHRTNMKFLCMDAMNTTFKNDEFNVVLDKGTLDALMPDDSEETQSRIDKYFSDIKRVLKLGGRYVCISLLQSHIMSKLLDTFCDKSWMFRIVRCHEAEEKNAENGDGMTLPVFAVIATKFKVMPQLVSCFILCIIFYVTLNVIKLKKKTILLFFLILCHYHISHRMPIENEPYFLY
jgi:ubiquinone/menaquinone biosynthesis C-methylase UbiE